MNLPFYIARRYLFSKKKHNAINIISGISVCGVALATLALVCTLSVFNGFQDMVAGFFTAFDPELKITIREGKVFDPRESRIRQVRALPEIDVWTETLEENAMVQYKDRQAMAVIKGVEDNFEQLTSIDSLLYGTGRFVLNDSLVDYGFMGVELMSELGTGIQFVDPLLVYAPKRNVRVNIANPTAAFNREYLFSPGAIFAVNQKKYDSRYILTSLGFARRLFNYDTEVSAIELKLKPGFGVDAVQKKIKHILGDRFVVQNRYEQQA
ncbi:ABC transporter permease, partial [Bacteroides heparinolyticus]